MDRRTFLAGTGAVLLAAPLAAEAQQAGKVLGLASLAGSFGREYQQWQRPSAKACVISVTSKAATSSSNTDMPRGSGAAPCSRGRTGAPQG